MPVFAPFTEPRDLVDLSREQYLHVRERNQIRSDRSDQQTGMLLTCAHSVAWVTECRSRP